MEKEEEHRTQHYYKGGHATKVTEATHLRGNDVDLEDQMEEVEGDPAAEYYVPLRTKYLYLSLYFALNVALTIYNKVILGKVRSALAVSKQPICNADGSSR